VPDFEADQQAREWSDALAAAWERNRDRLFESQRRVSDWLVDQLDPKPGQTILELAAGPGETGFLAAERVRPGGRLISTDVGPRMVDAARRGASARSLDNVECRVMDAQEIDLPDASVDGVLCRFGLMALPEPERALDGIRRVLRPGGRLAYAVWGPPDRNPWITLMAMAVIQRGHEPPANPFEPGGPFSLADPERNRALLRDAGFAEPVVEDLADVVRFEDFHDYWNLQSQVGGRIALFISSLPNEEVQSIRAAVETMIEPFASGDGYGFPSLAIAVASYREGA
jgi:ubiquinone/menaquinone biosynthesis C-methylase UbiE